MTTIALSLRPRLVPLLSSAAGLLIAAYVALMVTTILYAALQTKLAQNVQDTRMEIGKLEDTYYAEAADINATDPHTLGYVTPKHVEYVAASAIPNNLTFAGK